jgi:PAS domain S-box-containing protein
MAPGSADRAFFQTLVERSFDGLLLIDEAGVVRYANPAAAAMFAGSAASLVGTPFGVPAIREAVDLSVPNPLGMRTVEMRAETVIWEGRPATVAALRDVTEARHARDAALEALADRERLLKDAERIRLAQLSLLEDQREAQAALRESEARYRALVDQSISGIYAIDGGRITYFNPRAAEIFGYTQEEAVGKPVEDFVAQDDRAMVSGNIKRRLASETGSIQYEFRGLRKDGTSVLIGAHGSVMVVDGKRVIMGVLQDVTDKKRTEETIREYVKRLEAAVLGTAAAVSQMVELRDPYTAGHERRVGELSAALAAEMGLDANMQRGLRVAGAVHDVGKIMVPAEILSKPARLSPVEFEIIKQHAQQGYEVLKDVAFPWPVAEVARQHHERMDGSGYPRGLKGEAILLEARILAVADVVESMASHRPYRPGLGIAAALDEIEKNAGRLYDPAVAAACLRLFRETGYRIPD